MNGSSDGEERVEVCYQGVWTTEDGYSWDYNDARVLCRQLGYDDKCENCILVRNVDRIFINTKMQGLLPLEMLKVATKGRCTDTFVEEMKCHFSFVQMIHTQVVT